MIGLGVAGCGSDNATEAAKSPKTSVQATNPAAGPTAPVPGAPPTPPPAASPAQPAGHHYTIVDFIRDNGLVETQLHPGDPGAPTVDLPIPPGWDDARNTTPAWAWRAIYFTDPAMAAEPPNIVTIMSKRSGNGVGRVLAYAPGELRNLPDFEGDAGATKQVSGFNAWQLGGTFTRKEDGVKRAIVQTTVVFPAQDGVFVMQSNADGTPEQLGMLRDTMRIIDEHTTITA